MKIINLFIFPVHALKIINLLEKNLIKIGFKSVKNCKIVKQYIFEKNP